MRDTDLRVMNIKCFASTTDRNPLVPLETLIESKPSTVKRNDGKIDWDESRLDKWSNIKPMDYMFTREKNGYNRLEVKLLWEKLQVPNGRICFPVRFVSAVVSFLPNDWFHATSNTSRPPRRYHVSQCSNYTTFKIPCLTTSSSASRDLSFMHS